MKRRTTICKGLPSTPRQRGCSIENKRQLFEVRPRLGVRRRAPADRVCPVLAVSEAEVLDGSWEVPIVGWLDRVNYGGLKHGRA